MNSKKVGEKLPSSYELVSLFIAAGLRSWFWVCLNFFIAENPVTNFQKGLGLPTCHLPFNQSGEGKNILTQEKNILTQEKYLVSQEKTIWTQEKIFGVKKNILTQVKIIWTQDGGPWGPVCDYHDDGNNPQPSWTSFVHC